MDNDLISRKAACDAICGCFNIMEAQGIDMTVARTIAQNILYGAPAVDTAPVRHGHIKIEAINPYDGEDCYCSKCGHGSLLPDFKWCPYCGAKFDSPTCGPDYCEIGGEDDES